MAAYVGLKKGKLWEKLERSEYYCGRCGWKVTDHDSYCPECGGALHEGVEFAEQPYGWPRFEDGTPVKRGDEVLDRNGDGFVAHIISFNDGWSIGSGHGYGARSTQGIFKRPTEDQMAEYYKKWPTEKKERMKTIAYIRNGNGPNWAMFGYVANDGLDISDDVDHPKHYDNGKVECIDWIEEMLTPEEFRGYLKGAALKYQFRSERKGNPQKDLDKARWYISKLKEKLA